VTHPDPTAGPLSGVRVLDVGTRIAAPFCAGLFGELGADVIKVEDPAGGDFMRHTAPFEGDYSLYWSVEGRGRRSVAIDLRDAQGQQAFRELAATADVIVENFRPGTLERWNIGPADLEPRHVIVRISQFGQTGPLARRPGLDRLGIAFGGLMYITGYPDRPPVRPGVTVSDYLTGTFSAVAAVAALRQVERTGVGCVIDSSLYGSVLRILEWTVPAYDRLGIVRERQGNRLSHSAPLDNYLAADGRYVAIVAASDANFTRLLSAMRQPELLEDDRFATVAARAANADAINDIVADWCARHSSEDVEQLCVAAGVPAGVAYSVADIVASEHVRERGDLVLTDDPVLGLVTQQAPYPKLSTMAGSPAPAGAPRLGEHTEEVLLPILGEERYRMLCKRGVVGPSEG
jgi:formyl-CoA transferase